MSMATGPGGGFLVLQDFDVMVTSARRARGVTRRRGARARHDARAHHRGTGRRNARNGDVDVRERGLHAFGRDDHAGVALGLQAGGEDDRLRRARPARGRARGGCLRPGRRRGKFHGIVNATNGVATVAAATGSATTFKLADFRAVFAALPSAYAAGATWIMSPSAFLNAAGNPDTTGAPAVPSLHGPEPALFGRPVLVSPDLPVAAASARSVVVGDIAAGYAVRRVRGLGVHRQTELHSGWGRSASVSTSVWTVASSSRTRSASLRTRRRRLSAVLASVTAARRSRGVTASRGRPSAPLTAYYAGARSLARSSFRTRSRSTSGASASMESMAATCRTANPAGSRPSSFGTATVRVSCPGLGSMAAGSRSRAVSDRRSLPRYAAPETARRVASPRTRVRPVTVLSPLPRGRDRDPVRRCAAASGAAPNPGGALPPPLRRQDARPSTRHGRQPWHPRRRAAFRPPPPRAAFYSARFPPRH